VTRSRRRRAAVSLIVLAASGSLTGARGAEPDAPVRHRYVVDMRGMAFQPEVLEIRRGDTVVWINRDIVPHTATLTRVRWSTGPLEHGKSGRFVARRSGEQPYFCELHPIMRGRLLVR
jgi:plastocyanin